MFVQCCFTSTETVRTIRDREAQDVHLDFHSAHELCGVPMFVQCCFTSTETVRTIRDREAQDVHLD